MALSHDSYSFGSYTHGRIEVGPWAQPILRGSFPGVKGVVHLIDERKDRPFGCQYIISGLADASALQAAVDAINDQAGVLVGTLSVTGVFAVADLEKCTFLGFRPTQPHAPDGFGSWFTIGRLEWMQRGG